MIVLGVLVGNKHVIYVVRCAIWYYLYNLTNVKNTHGGVLLLLKVTLLYGCFSRFLNCGHGTESRNAPHNHEKIRKTRRKKPGMAPFLVKVKG